MHIYTNSHACTPTLTCAQTHAHNHTHACHIFTHTHTHMHVHTHSCTLTHTYAHTPTLTHKLTLLFHLCPPLSLVMAITSTCKPSRSSGSPGPCVALGAPLEPCTASSTWGNALTICGVDECTCDQVGTILGAWVYECVGAPSRTQESGFKPLPSLTDS